MDMFSLRQGVDILKLPGTYLWRGFSGPCYYWAWRPKKGEAVASWRTQKLSRNARPPNGSRIWGSPSKKDNCDQLWPFFLFGALEEFTTRSEMFGKEDQTLIRPWQAFQRDMALWNGKSTISSTENQRMVSSCLKSSKWPPSDLGEPRFALSLCWVRLGPQIFIDRGLVTANPLPQKSHFPATIWGIAYFQPDPGVSFCHEIASQMPRISQSYSIILLPSGDLHVAMERGALFMDDFPMKTCGFSMANGWWTHRCCETNGPSSSPSVGLSRCCAVWEPLGLSFRKTMVVYSSICDLGVQWDFIWINDFALYVMGITWDMIEWGYNGNW